MLSSIPIKQKYLLLFLGLTFLGYVIIIPYLPSYGDKDYWIYWSEILLLHPISRIYTETADSNFACNYPPLLLYILKAINIFFNRTAEDIANHVYLLKIVTLIFDYLPLIFASCCLPFLRLDIKRVSFFILNIAYLYNTILWGQVDAIYSCFGFMAISLFAVKRFFLGFVFLALALSMKAQSVIFLPTCALILLFHFRNNWRKQIVGATGFLLTTLIVFFPFWAQGKISELIATYTHSVGYYRNLTFNAHNFWYFVSPRPEQIEDTFRIWDISLHSIGFFLFFLSLLIVLFPFIRFMRMDDKDKKSEHDRAQSLWELSMLSTALVTLCFFYFNTQMHERYSHPIMLFLGMYGLSSGHWKLFFLASICYLVNMEGVGQLISNPNQSYVSGSAPYKVLNHPEFGFYLSGELAVSALFGILIVLSTRELYRRFHISSDRSTF